MFRDKTLPEKLLEAAVFPLDSDYYHTPLYQWKTITIEGISVQVRNAAAESAITSAIPRMLQTSSPTARTVLQLAQTASEQGQVYCYAYDLDAVSHDAAAMVRFLKDGRKKILLATRDRFLGLPFIHEWAHGVLPLAMPFKHNTTFHRAYAEKMRRALCADYWDYKKMQGLVPIQKRVARWIFHVPQSYTKREWLIERIAYGVQSMLESDAAVKSIAPRFYDILNDYVAHQARIPVPVRSPLYTASLQQPVRIWEVAPGLPDYHQQFVSNVSSQIQNQDQALKMRRRKLDVKHSPKQSLNLNLGSKNIRPKKIKTHLKGPLLFYLINPALHISLSALQQSPDNYLREALGDMISELPMAIPAILFGPFVQSYISAGISPEELELRANQVEKKREHVRRPLNEGDWISAEDGLRLTAVLMRAAKPLVHQCEQLSKLIKENVLPDLYKPLSECTATEQKFIAKLNAQAAPLREAGEKMWGSIKNKLRLSPPETTAFFPGQDQSLPNSTDSKISNKIDPSAFSVLTHHPRLIEEMTSAYLQNCLQGKQIHFTNSSSAPVDVSDQFHFQTKQTHVFNQKNKSTHQKEIKTNDDHANSLTSQQEKTSHATAFEFAKQMEVATQSAQLSDSHALLDLLNPLPAQFQTAPAIPIGPTPAMTLLEYSEQHRLFAVNESLPLFSPDFQSFLIELKETSMHAQALPKMEHNATAPVIAKPKSKSKVNVHVPTPSKRDDESDVNRFQISDVRIGWVDDQEKELGLIAQLEKGGEIGVSASVGRLLFSAKAGLDAGFWPAMGTAAVYGLAAFAVLKTIEHFYSQHVKHVRHKILSSIKHTQGDIKFISDQLSILFQKYKTGAGESTADLIQNIEGLKHHINKKIHKANKREQYAKKNHHRKAKKEHQRVIQGYRQHFSKLDQLKFQLEADVILKTLENTRKQFIDTHQDSSDAELHAQANALTIELATQVNVNAQVDELSKNGFEFFMYEIITKGKRQRRYGGWSGSLLPETAKIYIKEGKTVSARKGAETIPLKDSHYDEVMQKIMGLRKLLIERVVSLLQEGNLSDAKKLISTILNDENNQNHGQFNFSALSNFLDQLNQNTKENYEFWIHRVSECNSGKSALSSEESLALKAYSFNQLLVASMTRAVQGEMDSAKHILKSSAEVLPDYKKEIDLHITAQAHLTPLINQDGIFWMNWVESRQAIPLDHQTEVQRIEFMYSEEFALRAIFASHVVNKEFDIANPLFEKHRVAFPKQAKRIEGYQNEMKAVQALQTSEKEINFWKGEYETQAKKNNLNKLDLSKETQDPYFSLLSNIRKNNAVEKLIDKVKEKNELGLNREASKVAKWLYKKEKNPFYQEIFEDATFAHQGHALSLIAKPIQASLARYVQGCQPNSFQRQIGTGLLEALNISQIFAPNALPLLAQCSYALVNKDLSVLKRNINRFVSQLSCDINWRDQKYNPINSENHFNGAMIYSQLALKFIQNFPMNWFVSEERLLNAQLWQNQVILFGQNAMYWISIGTTALQTQALMKLKTGLFSSANAPHVLGALANAAVEGAYYGYDAYKKSRGDASEDTHYYRQRNAANWGINTCAAIASAGMIAKKGSQWLGFSKQSQFSWLTLTVGAAYSALGAYTLFYAASSQQEESINVLHAALNNLHYYQMAQEQFFDPEKKRHLSIPRIDGYLSGCIIRLINQKPNESIKKLILSGKEICFSKEIFNENAEFYIHFKNKNNQFESVRVLDYPAGFKLLDMKPEIIINSDQLAHEEFLELAKSHLIHAYLMSSMRTIEMQLNAQFDGLSYQENQLPIVNDARIEYFHQQALNFFREKNYEALIQLTNHTEEKGKYLISDTYKIPAHLVFKTLIYCRLSSYLDSPERLKDFRSEYEKYVSYISSSANESKIWYGYHWSAVKTALENVLKYSFQQFIIASQAAKSKEEALLYLSYINQHYHSATDWFNLLDDELKFWAAYRYHHLDQKENCSIFYNRIIDLPGLIQKKQNKNLTTSALHLLETVDQPKHADLLAEVAKGNLVAEGKSLLLYAISLLTQKAYTQAKTWMNGSVNFSGKKTAQAICLYESSHGADVFGALSLLMEEGEEKHFAYWYLLYKIVKGCLASIRYAPHQEGVSESNARLCGFLKICADQLQSFHIPFELKKEVETDMPIAMNSIKQFISKQTRKDKFISDEELNEKVNELIQVGHHCMRGDQAFNLVDEMKNILKTLSYEFVEGNIKYHYFSMDVPADGDCAFHVFGISRKEGINLLLQHVENRSWASELKDSHAGRKSVIEILLTDLEIKNNQKYDRTEYTFSENIFLIKNYLKTLLKSGTWMPYNQNACSVLDALAFLLNKNLSIFESNAKGELVLASSVVHDVSFERIEMLATSASGFSHEYKYLNHYTQLVKIPEQMAELVDYPKQVRVSQQGLFNHNSRQVTFGELVTKSSFGSAPS